MPRPGGRSDLQLRAMSSEQSLINQADGSARFDQGGKDGTSVLVSVQGPIEQRRGGSGEPKGVVEVVCKPAFGRPGPEDIERGTVIQAALEAVTMLTLIPGTAITVVVQTLNDDGSLLAASINAAVLAFLDCGVQMSGLVTASTCAMLAPGHIVVDPTAEEEKEAPVVVTTAWQKGKDGVVSSVTDGLFTQDEYFAMAEAGRAGAASALAFIRMAYAHKAQQDQDRMGGAAAAAAAARASKGGKKGGAGGGGGGGGRQPEAMDTEPAGASWPQGEDGEEKQ